jgi:hypothetical protein
MFSFQVAAISGHKTAVKTLLDNEANKKKRSFLNETPFDVVGHSKHAKAIRMLLDVRKKKQESKEEETKS